MGPFRDCPQCPEMVIVPAGTFEMGAQPTDTLYPDENPVHRVALRSFAIGKFHVTRGQFAAFVNETSYRTGDQCLVFERGGWVSKPGYSWQAPGFAQDDTHPAACIGWHDAKAYVAWLTRKTGRDYRLPSEAEWEYAARGGTKTARFWGESPDEACSYANVADAIMPLKPPRGFLLHKCSDGYAYTSPVGVFRPNAFGLFDMLGNLWQWTEDSWHPSYLGAPSDGSVWEGPPTHRSIRGGSWFGAVQAVRAARRDDGDTEKRSFDTGVRVAATLP